jgi:hypothetical protein
VPSKVENRGLAVAEGCQESQDNILVVSSGARVRQGSLVDILAPVHSNAAGPGRSEEREQERDEEERKSTLCL